MRILEKALKSPDATESGSRKGIILSLRRLKRNVPGLMLGLRVCLKGWGRPRPPLNLLPVNASALEAGETGTRTSPPLFPGLYAYALTLGLLLVLSAACNRSAPPAAQGPSTNQQVFAVTGVVQAVSLRQKQVEVKHEEVPGYMPAMTMPFDVKDTNELAGLERGQRVTFRLIVADTEAWIDRVRRTGLPGISGSASPGQPTTRLARDVEPLSPGDLFPEYRLTNQLNQPFSTRDFQGQALAITFLFTRCPYPAFCPRMTAGFESAQQKLLALPALTNWQLLTVTFDPDYDTTQVLKQYAEAHQYDPRHWTFATGALIDITALGEQFGLAFWRDQPGGGINHNLRTAVIDASGRVQKIFEGNAWTGEELAAELRLAAGKR